MVKRLGRRVLLPVAFWLAVWELCYRAVGRDLPAELPPDRWWRTWRGA